jgi:hypothetical protein
MEARYGEESADMVKHERSHILPQFEDMGYERIGYSTYEVDDEVLDGIEYIKINSAFERSSVVSKVEFNILGNVMGDIALSFTEQRNKHRTELSVHHELHNALHRDTCDNYFLEIINALKVRLPESHAKKVTILETRFDEMLQRYDGTVHRISHLTHYLTSTPTFIRLYF